MKIGFKSKVTILGAIAVTAAVAAYASKDLRWSPLPAALSPPGLLTVLAVLCVALVVAAAVQASGQRTDEKVAQLVGSGAIGVILDRRTALQVAEARGTDLVDFPGRASLVISDDGLAILSKAGSSVLTIPWDELDSVEKTRTPGVGNTFAALRLGLKGGRVDLTFAGGGFAGMTQKSDRKIAEILGRIRARGRSN